MTHVGFSPVFNAAERTAISKSVVLITIAVVTSMVATFTMLSIKDAIFSEAEFHPLYGDGYSEPQQIIEPKATPGLLPSIRPGDSIVTYAEKCSSEDSVGVTGSVLLRKIEPPPLPQPTILFTGSRVRDAGCITDTYTTTIPAGTEPGVYEIVGTEIASKGDARQQTITWRTASFEVVADAR